MAEDTLTIELLRGLRIALSIIVITVMLGLNLPALLASISDYRAPWIGATWFAILMIIAVVDAALVLGNRGWGVARWPVVAVVMVVSWMATFSLPAPDLAGRPHWTLGSVGWFCAVLFSDKSIRYVLAFVAVHDAASVAQLAIAGRWDHASLVTLAIVLVNVSSFQIAVAAAASALRTVAQAATAAARVRAEVTARNDAAERVHLDRQRRYVELQRDVVPLLESIRSGAAEPADRSIRWRAALEAARLRRLFSEQSDVVQPLAIELGALVDMIQRRGVNVSFVVRPTAEMPETVRRTLLEEVSGLLLASERSARVTLGGTADEVVVSVVADGTAADFGSGVADHGVRTFAVADETQTWVEARWASAPASPS